MENSNQSAFPVADTVAQGQRFVPLTMGLTKREYFAGQIMQGLVSFADEQNYPNTENLKASANSSVMAADFLLEALAKEK